MTGLQVAELRGCRPRLRTLILSMHPNERYLSHRANILEKLWMHDRVELTRYAIRQGLVEP